MLCQSQHTPRVETSTLAAQEKPAHCKQPPILLTHYTRSLSPYTRHHRLSPALMQVTSWMTCCSCLLHSQRTCLLTSKVAMLGQVHSSRAYLTRAYLAGSDHLLCAPDVLPHHLLYRAPGAAGCSPSPASTLRRQALKQSPPPPGRATRWPAAPPRCLPGAPHPLPPLSVLITESTADPTGWYACQARHNMALKAAFALGHPQMTTAPASPCAEGYESRTCSGRRCGSTSGNTSCMSGPRCGSAPSAHRGPLCSASASLPRRLDRVRVG